MVASPIEVPIPFVNKNKMVWPAVMTLIFGTYAKVQKNPLISLEVSKHMKLKLKKSLVPASMVN